MPLAENAAVTPKPTARFTGMTAMKKLLEANTAHGQRRVADVFRDFCEIAAISVRNTVDQAGGDVREQRYLDIAERYTADELHRFAEILSLLARELEERPSDVLGQLYMTLDLGNDRTGQFFTPYDISVVMARMMLSGPLVDLKDQPFITLSEPTCGSGGMVVAATQVMRSHGINYQQRLHVTAQDVDITAVHMAYVQLSLLSVPAVVTHGNTLTLEVNDQWLTPAHVLDGWPLRLARAQEPDQKPHEEGTY